MDNSELLIMLGSEQQLKIRVEEALRALEGVPSFDTASVQPMAAELGDKAAPLPRTAKQANHTKVTSYMRGCPPDVHSPTNPGATHVKEIEDAQRAPKNAATETLGFRQPATMFAAGALRNRPNAGPASTGAATPVWSSRGVFIMALAVVALAIA
jgi:hypothetical protein